MFNPQFDDPRKIIANTQEHMLSITVQMGSLHPEAGGNGLDDPLQALGIVRQIAAEVHNVALALGHVIDVLDQESNQ